MSTADFHQLLEYVGAFGLGGVISGFLVFLLLKSFIPSYLNEKAKNLATREDVASITHEIEHVRSQYAIIIEELKAKHQLRLAAIDRRLQAHQEAFTLWRELLKNIHTENIGTCVIKCQDWWEKNCLYLEPSARDAFSRAYSSAHTHNAHIQGGTANLLATKENWQRIIQAGSAILEAAQLPGLTEAEQEELQRLTSSGTTHDNQ